LQKICEVGLIPRREYRMIIGEKELLLFIKELGRLLEDYKKCKDKTIQKEIHLDILLLSEVIDPNKEWNY
jgi:hypothetical protein